MTDPTPTLPALNLDALRKIAEAATRGPWWTGQHSLGARKIDVMADGGWHMPKTEADAAHIAAFDPPTVLALIAKAREAEGLWLELLTQAQTSLWHEEDAASARADLATARAQLAMAREALERLSALTPGAANSATPRDLHLTVKAIADTALAQLSEAPK